MSDSPSDSPGRAVVSTRSVNASSTLHLEPGCRGRHRREVTVLVMRKTEPETTNEQRSGDPIDAAIDQHRAHLVDRVGDLRYLVERESAPAGQRPRRRLNYRQLIQCCVDPQLSGPWSGAHNVQHRFPHFIPPI